MSTIANGISSAVSEGALSTASQGTTFASFSNVVEITLSQTPAGKIIVVVGTREAAFFSGGLTL